MDQETILLNGGQDREVLPAAGADEYLEGLLGGAASRPTVPSLRVVDDPEGHKSVGVFIGARQIGHLPRETGSPLVDTLQACEENSATARVRGTLLAAEDQPGKVAITVSLADPDYLLADPVDSPPAAAAEGTSDPSGLSTSLEDGAAFFPSSDEKDDLSSFLSSDPVGEESSTPELSAGVADDWPDWPPPGMKAESSSSPDQTTQPDEPLPTVESSPGSLTTLSRSIFGPGPESAPPPSEDAIPIPGPEDMPQDPSLAPPEPLTPPGPSMQSRQPTQTSQPQAPAQSGWLAGPAQGAQTSPPGGAPQSQQSGYLAGQKPSGQSSLGGGIAGATLAGAGGTLAGGATLAGGTLASGPSPPATTDNTAGSPATDSNVSWQDFNTSPSKSMTAPPEGWTPVTPATQAAAKTKPPRRHNSVATWIISIVAVAVVAAAGFFIWKTQFAPVTYTDPQYGYSFSYPHGWEMYDLTEDIATSTPLTMEGLPVNGVMVGTVDTNFWGTEEQFNAAMVAVVELGVFATDSEIMYGIEEVRRELDQVQDLYVDGMYISMIEPATYVQLGGLDGVACAMRMEAYGIALVEKICILFQGSRMYMVVGMCDGDSWPKSQGTIDSLIESFNPGP